MATKSVQTSKKGATTPTSDNGALRLLQAMGLSAVLVSPGVMALTSTSKLVTR